MINPDDANDCFRLSLTGVPIKEIASVKSMSTEEVRRAIESEVSDRVDADDFDTLDDALDYLRLGRLQKGLWTSATKGGVKETRQVIDLIEQRNDLKKSSKKAHSLDEAVLHMLNANNVNMTGPEEQEDE